MAKLTVGCVQAIRERLRARESQTSIAKDYGISQATVSWINRRKTWKEIA
jgi:DNA invertase Pin-like site-specific DNA recombinase